jgi:CRP-like cAMP-binding protein
MTINAALRAIMVYANMRQGIFAMRLENDITILHNLPIFRGMAADDLSMLAFSCERLLFRSGELITEEGKLGQAAYVILSGSARISEGEGERRRVHMISPGAIIGEMAMLVEYGYGSSVVAMEETEVLEINRKLIHMMMRDFPHIAEHFSTRIHSRLAIMADNLRRLEEKGHMAGERGTL